jgi:16S rRNA (uracil1498-N3)-methyltransferase
MTRRRWIADEVSGNRAVLIGEHARRLAQVLRAGVGQQFDISTGKEVRRSTIIQVDAERVEFELGEVVADEPDLHISIALSVFKFDRMEWAIEKCTELGVVKIIPVIAARSEPRLAVASRTRVERWRRIAQQASEQSRRRLVPEITSPAALKELLTMTAQLRIFLSESENETLLKDAVTSHSGSLLLAFGPEGGWKQQEISDFTAHGWTAASLGPTILRAETAAIAAVAIAAALTR